MQEHKTIIDSNGYIVGSCVLFEDGNPQEFKLLDGQQAVERINNKMLKPQYINGKWVETATQEELNVAYPVIEVKPSPQELLNSKLLKDSLDAKIQLANQQKLNADLLLKLSKIGGIANV